MTILNNLDSESEKTPQYFFSQMRTDIVSTLTEEQKREFLSILKRAIRVPTKKILNINFAFWFIKRFYLTVYFGFDKRVQKRVFSERKRDYIFSAILKAVICLIVFFILFSSLFFIIYSVKSALGIDFFPDKHLGDFF